MKKKTHTESEMENAIKELESGIDADTVARDHDVSKATLYNWKSKYSGMEISQVERLHELEAENRRLKQMYAEIALDNKILKEVLEKKSDARGQARTHRFHNQRVRHWDVEGVQADGASQVPLLFQKEDK